jgi:tRNA 5-methylaminomethyl-2-thiouridine biosynthesis bifunctional protein
MALLLPPDLSIDEGVPKSQRYDDVYHSRQGGLTQARHVFLAGNGLPQRWQGRARFVIFETGFGLGLNFLATVQAFLDDPKAPACLHFVSVEAHPLSAAALRALHHTLAEAEPGLMPLITALQEAWPLAVPGVHRRFFLEGRVVLTLFFGEAQAGVDRFSFQADAFYLDGFSPSKNPQMWSESLMRELARKAAPDATLATWCVSGAVRRALKNSGAQLEKTSGFGAKREMLRGVFPKASLPCALDPQGVAPATPRTVLVVGAGLAGAGIAERLAFRGWQVQVLEARAQPAQGASGNHAGVLRPLPSLDDNRISRLTRSGSVHALAQLRDLEKQPLGLRWWPCGVLHLGRDDKQAQKMAKVVQAHGLPDHYIRFVSALEASEIAGLPVSEGGWWFEESGAVVRPRTLCEALLARYPLTLKCAAPVDRLEHIASENPCAQRVWVAKDAEGRILGEAHHLVLACGTGLKRLSQTAFLPIVPARGQVSIHTQPALENPAPHAMERLKTAVCRQAYVTPMVDGAMAFGATFSVEPDEPPAYALRVADHAENREKLQSIFPQTPLPSPEMRNGRVGFRPATPDRLPMMGPLVDETGAQLPGAWVLSGFGARGLVFGPLLAETLASWMHGDPLPLETDLIDAMHPRRFCTKIKTDF